MKKNLIALSAALALCALSSCGKSSTIHIGILQLVSAPPLNAVAENFEAEIKASDWAKGKTIEFDLQNPQADETTMATMATKLASSSDLVLSIATSASQAMKQAIGKLDKEIPLVFSAVTDPVGANLVTTTTAAPGSFVTGVSDMGDPKKSMDLIADNFPSIAKKIGMIYNTGESNSRQQIALATAEAEAKGWTVFDKAVSSETEIATSLAGLGDDVKMLYYPTDNMCASNTAQIAKFCKERGVFACCGDSSLVATATGGALFSLGVDYASLGTQAGSLALSILDGTKKASECTVEFANKLPLVVNTKVATDWGVTLPQSLISAADEVISQ